MDTVKHQRKQLAKAILELHDIYISTGEEEKPMTISLPDLAGMADLPEDMPTVVCGTQNTNYRLS
ncbi:hypothetical protein [Cytophaga hutchinsonii]|uniref:Uncharacterized protein n=1 Tax=Cytophaga hutchinsonii (strain ATCC 33406 / DSM 1761 / CIP 103989 / NBRC 15051 / NCIMB 9469 / D465) TaxID=269798 RepID=A0A6N4SNQ9_CYTH3|nr:hypothetical protein [Cytophaga hutchinsonii]ABG57926.1 hypothetical protein CHU_0639 [Cytophaga hutchinsonii ATCC 33406]SFX09195.1 hypothetical protein SAMN04487930_101480 [Cytophaga hutchinsonii ATCC 33406]